MGQKGSVVVRLSSQTHFVDKAKVSASATYSCKNKHNARSHSKITEVKIVVVLTKNWCLIGS